MKILAVESSCDETAAAVVEDGLTVCSNIIASQIEEHKKFGGVVPEIASRRHCENILDVTKHSLDEACCTIADIDAFAVTYAPGLIGALLVGTNFAKGLAMATGKPLIPVHHIAGHIAANYLTDSALKPPYLWTTPSTMLSAGLAMTRQERLLTKPPVCLDFHTPGAFISTRRRSPAISKRTHCLTRRWQGTSTIFPFRD